MTAPVELAPPSRTRATVLSLLQNVARVAALAAVFLIFGAIVPGGAFFSPGNIENILMQSAVYTMAGLGMTMVIITGGIDLAAGSTIALSMVMTALALNYNHETLRDHPLMVTTLAIVIGTTIGAAVGLLQGLIITGLRLVPFVVTLGGMLAIRAFAKELAKDQEISPPPTWLYEKLMFPVQGRVFNWQIAPVGVWATLVAAILAAALLRYTRLGRHIFAIGSNESTARLCGVPVARTQVTVYLLAGLFAGLAGVLEFSKLNLGQPTGAVSYELYIIAACVIGGTSLRGGVGSIFGTVVGALLIGVLNAGAQQAGWPKRRQEMVIGLVIIVAVALDGLRSRKKA
ncbi:MAG: ABC transporter permease [Tepidisphaeraceae bacterium]